MVGEVWICSGQSNMEMPLAGWGQITNFEAEIANANHPNIRLFQVEKSTKLSPAKDLKVMGNSWLVCSPATVPEFSATAYFFAVNLSKMLNNIPIGLIHTSWGGTPAEAWTSKKSLQLMPDFKDYLFALNKVPTNPIEQKKYLDDELTDYKAQLMNKDRGYSDGKALWALTSVDDKDWQIMYVPQNWEEQSLKDFDGVVWFRKDIEILPTMWGEDIILSLGTIDDNEITYFNGVQIGCTEGWDQERIYKIPGKLVKAGKNVIAVRVFDSGGEGGFYGSPNKVFLLDNSAYKIPLSGVWKYRIGFNMKEIIAPKVMPNQVQPTTLFNGMINPLIPFSFQGVIWYQGEANEFRSEQYSRLFPLLIHDWRTYWNNDFPFYFVQLANYKKREDKPTKAEWAELRDAQGKGLNLSNTGMAVSIDIGNAENIHPKNKQDVGYRLALIAANKTYKLSVVCEGPSFKSFVIKGSKIEINFESVGSGMIVRNDPILRGFAIAGTDKKFHWAKAEIFGDKVIVYAPEVEFPIAVRYAWANNPDCNLYNLEGLPAAPFRTDNWND
jgi:sialate O-acetylesterase